VFDRPKGGFIHPQCFAHERIGPAERFKHFNGSASNTIGMTAGSWFSTTVHRGHRQFRVLGELCGEDGSGGTGTDHQNVNRFGQLGALPHMLWCRRGNTRVSEGVTVEVVLHADLPFWARMLQYILCRTVRRGMRQPQRGMVNLRWEQIYTET